MGVVVFVSYKPFDGQREALLELIRAHLPLLRELELATHRPGMVLQRRSGGDEILEVFEWASEEAGRSAHEHPRVQDLWSRMARVCDFIPMADLDETRSPFAHFEPV